MSDPVWCVRTYKNGECTACVSSFWDFDYVVSLINRSHVSHEMRRAFEEADFICVQPRGNMFVERTQQLEQVWDSQQRRVKSRSSE